MKTEGDGKQKMPRSLYKYIAKDVLASLDPDINAVKFDSVSGELVIEVVLDTKTICASEQDLLSLLDFLREEKQKCP